MNVKYQVKEKAISGNRYSDIISDDMLDITSSHGNLNKLRIVHILHL